MACPNVNLKSWKDLVKNVGEDTAYYLWDKYEGEVPKEEMLSGRSIMYGLDEANPAQLEFSMNTLNAVSGFLQEIGIDQSLVPEILSPEGNVVEGALAAANFIKGTVEIIDDVNKRPAAWNKLPEEAAHFWYRLLDNNSELKQALLTASQTSRREAELRESLYGEVYDEGPRVIGKLALDEEGNVTQLPELSPIREEAIGQLIAESIKRIEEKNASAEDYSFLKSFLEWINSLIGKFKNIFSEVDPFEVAAMKILAKDTSDLMSYEEYKELNNIVDFTEKTTDRSDAPFDYSIISDLGKVKEGFAEWGDDEIAYTYKFIGKDKTSPTFDSKEELDVWMFKNFGDVYDRRQQAIIDEVKSSEDFINNLVDNIYAKRTRFLKKTLDKFIRTTTGESIDSFKKKKMESFRNPMFVPSMDNISLTLPMDKKVKDILIRNNAYENVAPTLKVLPNLLNKYGKRPIVLSEDIKVDGAKKQELAILDAVKEQIKSDNPDLKSITASEFADEVHNFLKSYYLLGFANEQSHLDYRVSSTFEYNTRDVYHNKVSIRFNDTYHDTAKRGYNYGRAHFSYAPSAWGNLTYFYSKKDSTSKDAVLLHEIQNDNIEYLRKLINDELTQSVDSELSNYLVELDANLSDYMNNLDNINVPKLTSSTYGFYMSKYHQLNSLLDTLRVYRYNTTDGFNDFKRRVDEIKNLSADVLRYNNSPEKITDDISKEYSKRRTLRDFYNRGGLKSLLTVPELNALKKEIDEINTKTTTDWEGNPISLTSNEKKRLFADSAIVKAIENNINDQLKERYGKDAPNIKLNAPLKPVRSRLGQEMVTLPDGNTTMVTRGNAQLLNDNMKYLIIHSEKKNIENISKRIEGLKKEWLNAKKKENTYNFFSKLAKISEEKYAALQENFNYNQELREKLVEQRIKDIERSFSNKEMSPEEVKERDQLIENAKQNVENLRKKAIDKKLIFEKDVDAKRNEANKTLDVESGYFVPLVHHLIQKHLREYGESVPMYFSGFDTTLLTQYNEVTAAIYAGKEEVSFKGFPKDNFKLGENNYTIDRNSNGEMIYVKDGKEISKNDYEKAYLKIGETYVKELRVDAGRWLLNLDKSVPDNEVLSQLADYLKYDDQNYTVDQKKMKLTQKMIDLNDGRPFQTGVIYNALSQLPGVKLVYQDAIPGLQKVTQYGGGKSTTRDAGGYFVDLSGYNYNAPVLYGLDMSRKQATVETKAPEVMMQTEDVPSSKATPETIEKVKTVIEKMGLNVKNLAEYAKSSGVDVSGVNGVADLTRKVIAIADGKTDVALTEEMVHMATAIIESKNPGLITEMISKIDRFAIYKRVFDEYKNRKDYQLENGKPNIRKIKKEAVDKLITEVIINKNQGDNQFPELRQEENQSMVRIWFNKIMDAIRGFYKATNIKVFEDTASEIMGDNFTGTIKDIQGEGQFFQLTDKQTEFQEKIARDKLDIEKVYEDKDSNPMLLDSEEANNYYRFRNAEGNWERVGKRVTDRVKAWYASKFPGKVFSPEEIAFNEIKRKTGVKGHLDLEEIHSRYYHEDGTRRDAPLDRPDTFNIEDEDMYDKLERYYVDLIEDIRSKSKGEPLIMSEVVLYDRKQNEAGTIDFLAIEPSGKAHILDWKFMHFTKDEIAWFKEGAFNIQLKRYKEMLRDQYGITEFGLTRAIPFAMEFGREVKSDPSSKIILKKLAVGSVDPSQLKDIRLVPIAEQSESTGFAKLDKFISRLSSLYSQIEKEKVIDEDEREFKIERLNVLRRAIRHLRAKNDMSEIVKTVEIMRKDGERILEDYAMTYKDRPATKYDSTDSELSDFSENMENFIKFADVFINIDRDLGSLIYNTSMKKDAKTEAQREDLKERREIVQKLQEEASMLYELKQQIQDAASEFADKHIGQRNLVTGLTKAEAVVKGLFSRFRGVSELPLASLKILYKVTRSAQIKAQSDALERVNRLLAIRANIVKRFPDARKAVQQLYQKDEKGQLANKLIHKYKREFFDAVDKMAATGGSKQWLRENIDVDAYMEAAEKIMEKQIKSIERMSFEGDDQEVRDQKDDAIEKMKRKWDINRKDFYGWDNYEIKRHPLDKWYSDDYLKIKSDKDLSELYDFIYEMNTEAKEIGYISNMVYKNFLPFIRKGMAERLVWDHSLSPMKNFANNLQIRTDDVGYGEINKVTGELDYAIPKYYTHDFTKTENGINDYSDVSEDLFKNMILYVQHVQKYKYMSEVEGQLKLVKTIETWKNHLKTNRVGRPIKENGEFIEEKGNETNTKMYDNFLRVLLYDQKYVLSDEDAAFNVGKVTNFVKKGINRVTKKVSGKEIFSVTDNPSPTSMIKTIDAANRAFQLKTLGLEFISGAVNAFGGNIQVATQAGNYFKAREFAANELKLIKNRFTPAEREAFIELIDTFMPLKEDPSYDKYKAAGLNVLTRKNFGDMLMVFMRHPELHIEKSIFLSLLDNMMVENGKIVSIPEFVKAKYKDRFKSGQAYKEAKGKIKSEIEELKRTRAISKIKRLEKKVVDGKEVNQLVIPGLDLTDKNEIQRLTDLTRRISRNATGGLADADVNLMSMSIWTRSMMIFKNWIPKLTDTRFGEFRKVADDFSTLINEDGLAENEKYDIGRIRLFFYVMGTSIRDRQMNITNILMMNDKGIKYLDEAYEKFGKEYEEKTGQKFTMEKEDFMELIRTNLRNQIKEFAILLALTAMYLSVSAGSDDGDKAAKNKHNFIVKTLDRFVNELSFFYNPASYEGLLKGGIFPAVGLVTDASKFMTHLTMEVTGYDITNPSKSYDEIRKNARPVKYGLKMFPIGKSVLNYFAMFDSDFAKDWDISIQKENTIGR